MNQQFVKETMWIVWNLSCVAGFLAVYGYMVFVETTCYAQLLVSSVGAVDPLALS